MNNNKIDLSIIIVSHNHSVFLKNNFDSILEKTLNISYEIILVNNVKQDPGISEIKTSYPEILLIENDRCKGFSENNNIGIKKSKGEYIVILNPDTYLSNNAFEIMISYLRENKNVGICGAKLLNVDDSIQFSYRKFPTFNSFLFRRTPLRLFTDQNSANSKHLMMNSQHYRSTKVDWMLGACLMIEKKLIINMGLLDENFFMYCEDIDICYRVNKYGLECHYLPKAIIYHLHQGESDKKLLSKYSFFHLKSMAYFIYKHKYFKQLFS